MVDRAFGFGPVSGVEEIEAAPAVAERAPDSAPAAPAAAAELGRHSTTGGFGLLEQLPDRLKEVDGHGRTRLFRLFQPQPDTRSSFALIWNLRRRSGVGKILGLLTDLARMSAGTTPIATPIILLIAVTLAIGVLILAGPWSLLVGVPLAAIGVVVAGGVRLLKLVPDRLAQNYFGLCNGMTPSRSTPSPSTATPSRMTRPPPRTPSPAPSTTSSGG